MDNRRTNHQRHLPTRIREDEEEHIQMLTDAIINNLLTQLPSSIMTESMFPQTRYGNQNNRQHQSIYDDVPQSPLNNNNDIQFVMNALRDVMTGYNNNIRIFIETIYSIQQNLNRTSSRGLRQQQPSSTPPIERHPNRNTYDAPRFYDNMRNPNRPPVAPRYPTQHANPLFNAIYTIFTRPATEINQFENVIVRPIIEQKLITKYSKQNDLVIK